MLATVLLVILRLKKKKEKKTDFLHMPFCQNLSATAKIFQKAADNLHKN